MLDAKPVVVSAIGSFDLLLLRCFLRFGEGIERHLRALVSNGVEADLEAGQEALFRHFIEL